MKKLPLLIVILAASALFTVATALFVGGGSVAADPSVPPPPSVVLPSVFCFRITDIRADKTDLEGDRFTIEFEILNWTNVPEDGLYVALAGGNAGLSPVIIVGAGTDPDGRPLIPVDVNGDTSIDSADLEDANNNGILDLGEDQNGNDRLDNDPIPGNLNPTNDWTATSSISTATWSAGTAIPPRDLLGVTSTAQANALIPGFPGTTDIDFGNVTPTEAIDDGDNVLDGFTLTVDDVDPGDIFSLNWFATNGGQEIGVSGQGNAFGFGNINIRRSGGPQSPISIWEGNNGLQQSPADFFDGVFNVPDPASFAMELGVAITAPFDNPSDNIFAAGINVGPQLAPVGGIAEFPDDSSDLPASSADGSGRLFLYAALAGAAAAVVALMATGGWYARRRFRQTRI